MRILGKQQIEKLHQQVLTLGCLDGRLGVGLGTRAGIDSSTDSRLVEQGDNWGNPCFAGGADDAGCRAVLQMSWAGSFDLIGLLADRGSLRVGLELACFSDR